MAENGGGNGPQPNGHQPNGQEAVRVAVWYDYI